MALVSSYVLHETIAAGGMGTVHLGRRQGHGGFARTVAIKRLHEAHARDPQFVAAFLKEARLASRIHHPNVVPTLDVVAQDDELLLVMEYVHGCSLAQMIRTDHDVPPAIATGIVAQALRGLHAAHEARSETGEPLALVHRDVSPQNILVDVQGVARLVDFGVAKAAGYAATTQSGALKGKLAYMAPEQVSSGILDRRTDLYAAAIVLWELLARERLFAGDSESMTFARAARGGALPVATRCAGLDPRVAAAVDRALSVAPDDRFPDALAMAVELEPSAASGAAIARWLASARADVLAIADARLARVEQELAASAVPIVSTRAAIAEATLAEVHRPSRIHLRAGVAVAVLATASASVLVIAGVKPAPTPPASASTALTAEPASAAQTAASVTAAPTGSVAADQGTTAATNPSAGAGPRSGARATPERPRPGSDVASPPAARRVGRPHPTSPPTGSATAPCRVEAFTGDDGLRHYRQACP